MFVYSNLVLKADLVVVTLPCGVWPAADLMVVFGGAAHSESEGWDATKTYGDNVCILHYVVILVKSSLNRCYLQVVDMDDFAILDWYADCWLPTSELRHRTMRGGVNVAVPLGNDRVLLTGGMHSDDGSDLPVFHQEIYSLSFQNLR